MVSRVANCADASLLIRRVRERKGGGTACALCIYAWDRAWEGRRQHIHGNMDTYVTEKGGWEAVHRMQNQLRSKQKSTTRRVRDKVLII